MIDLLSDDDGEVRFYAARALVRLVNQNMGHAPEAWRNQKFALDDWNKWWQEHKDRYPGGPMSPKELSPATPLMQKAKS
jgi:hypothetical protein